MDILPLLYYLKYFILHVGYKLLQSGFYIYIHLYIKRIFFWCIKNTGDWLLQATRNIVIVWAWRKTGLHEPGGNTYLSGVIPNSCFERTSFWARRAFPFLAAFELITAVLYAENKAVVRGRCGCGQRSEQRSWGDPGEVSTSLCPSSIKYCKE